MNNRYSRIFTINNAFYAPNCPIIISSGALSKDNKLGNFVAQFKFLNASTKTIKEVAVEISYYDASKNLLEAAVPFTYSNLEASPGELFGQKTPITILNPATRIISTKIKNIVFLSGEKLIIEEQELKPVPQKQELPDFLGKELAIQYAKDVYKDSKYVPMVFDGFWSCTCGSINQIGDSCCNSCRTKKDKQFLGLDRNLLVKNKIKAEEEEQKKIAEKKEKQRLAEIEQQKLQEEKEKAQKKKKTVTITISASILLVVIATFLLIGAIMRSHTLELLVDREYEDTIYSSDEVRNLKITFINKNTCSIHYSVKYKYSGNVDEYNIENIKYSVIGGLFGIKIKIDCNEYFVDEPFDFGKNYEDKPELFGNRFSLLPNE